MIRLLGLRHPFFLPRWRRVATVLVLAGWTIVELAVGSPLWAMFLGILALVTGYEFFVTFDPANYERPDA